MRMESGVMAKDNQVRARHWRMLSGSEPASPSKSNTNPISKLHMTEQSSSPNNSSEDKIESLKRSGQAAFSSKDYEAAVEHFSNALQLMLENVDADSLHISLAPLYLAYGNALLQLAIQKSSDKLVNTELVPSEMVHSMVSGMDGKENIPISLTLVKKSRWARKRKGKEEDLAVPQTQEGGRREVSSTKLMMISE